ncbi:hypothetical protein HHI36_005566 [Cryptolaemus montrouzieri]|uniref:C2H2-type domain-containing protein n=1 Tax=Cryptolaemus montrouzieri TaxID=559131 RepID=A0ABD2NUH8_9CUCU
MKRKGHLAVFENILGEKSTDNQQDEDSLDVLEEEEVVKPKRRKKIIKLCDETRVLVCKYQGCSEEFRDYYKFNQHLVSHIKNEEDGFQENFFCKFGNCDFRPTSMLHAIQHISLHGYHENLMDLGKLVASRDSLPDCHLENCFGYPLLVESYVCEWKDCDMTFETICDFIVHVKMHVNGNPGTAANINCGWKGCTKSFTMRYQLTKHVPVHTKEKYIACPTCGNTFSSLVRYSDHRSKQLPKERQNYKCSQCSKLFATENLLRDHVRAHINQYKCSMCDMTCPKPSNLANHIKFRHMDYRPFKCNLCDHASISKSNLEMHLITHCVEKLLACADCDFQCRSMYGLDKHIQREHGQNYVQTFECHLCKKQFSRGAFLTRHLMKIHGMQWPSGHSRFRYKEDSDGICRLQTIRYETVDVIKEILKSKTDSPSTSSRKLRCRIVEKTGINGEIALEANIEDVAHDSNEDSQNISTREKTDSNNVLLMISDLDEQGNVVSQVTESQEIVCKAELDGEEVELLEFS